MHNNINIIILCRYFVQTVKSLFVVEGTFVIHDEVTVLLLLFFAAAVLMFKDVVSEFSVRVQHQSVAGSAVMVHQPLLTGLTVWESGG